jgi:thiaminase/transcriptional activator TenA
VGLAARLWAEGEQRERRIRAHPFVRGIGDGSLPPERFARYLRQDYLFLLEYARVLALAVAAAEEPGDMAALADLLHATLHGEMALHRRAAAELGITARELEETCPAPYTFAYTRHLLAVARAGSLGEIAAALLPCQWGYARIGRELRDAGLPGVRAYDAWIAAYAGEEYQATARRLWELVDRLGEGMGSAERSRAARAFAASMACEYLFWDGCWTGADWPGGPPP